jgi:hypothetical protein
MEGASAAVRGRTSLLWGESLGESLAVGWLVRVMIESRFGGWLRNTGKKRIVDAQE